MIYHLIAERLTDEGRLKLDAALGDADAQRELDERRRKAVLTAGGGIG